MVPFLKAEQLKQQYAAFGCFYHLEIDGGSHVLPCRNVLELYDREAANNPDEKLQLPDAIIIMMNPGKSCPLDDQFTPPVVKERNLNLIISRETLVPAKPEQHVYQVMRLMNANGWKHVRVLNLSDLREADHRKFSKFIQKPKINKHLVHSIFSDKRVNERNSALERKEGAPIIAAWGKEEFLIPLAEKCLSIIPKESLLGIPVSSDVPLYFNAAPPLQEQKVRWLETIQQQVESSI